ncbi:MAG: hypothetical protein P4M08_14830 [Oligoflexia bacterium]|nr:hypothetical protein [Oligoflexia bacterium]
MEATSPRPYWRKCSTCKKTIGFNQTYWVCSVSTCNRIRTGLVFCSVACVDAHIPMMNHRDAGAFEKRSPTEGQFRAQQSAAVAPAAPADSPTPARPAAPTDTDQEILTVVSKVKAYVREKSAMNTSDAVMNRLSNHIRRWAMDAIQKAKQDGRETVMDRDFR